MPEYRFYTIAYDGHIKQPATSHELPNDRAANDKAKQLFDGHDIEIWQGHRLVAYIVPDQKPVRPPQVAASLISKEILRKKRPPRVSLFEIRSGV